MSAYEASSLLQLPLSLCGDFYSARDATPLWDTPQKRIYIRKYFKSAFRLIIAKMLADTPLSMHPLPNLQKKFEKNKFFNNWHLSNHSFQFS